MKNKKIEKIILCQITLIFDKNKDIQKGKTKINIKMSKIARKS